MSVSLAAVHRAWVRLLLSTFFSHLMNRLIGPVVLYTFSFKSNRSSHPQILIFVSQLTCLKMVRVHRAALPDQQPPLTNLRNCLKNKSKRLRSAPTSSKNSELAPSQIQRLHGSSSEPFPMKESMKTNSCPVMSPTLTCLTISNVTKPATSVGSKTSTNNS